MTLQKTSDLENGVIILPFSRQLYVQIEEVRKNTITVFLQSCSTCLVPKPNEKEKQFELIERYRRGDIKTF